MGEVVYAEDLFGKDSKFEVESRHARLKDEVYPMCAPFLLEADRPSDTEPDRA